jgi:predicted PurR-regulated permease PerM
LVLMPVRVPAVGPAVGAAPAGAAALVAAGGALVAAGGAAACCELRLLQASISGSAASAPPVARVHFKNDRRLT